MSLRILTYNLNGIRAAAKKGFFDFVKQGDYDLINIQETKAHKDQVDLQELRDLGYHDYWFSAEKKGYSGVLTLTKTPPKEVRYGMDNASYDKEGRLIELEFENFSLINCYFPSGTSGDARQLFKMEFLEYIAHWVEAKKRIQPNIILVGDYNIAHTELDIHDPIRNKNTSGFKPEEREWFSNWLQSGWVDAYRHANPDTIEYSWWSYRARARENNKGWRIDYQCVTTPLAESIESARHLTDGHHSDHCGLLVEYKL